MAISIEYSSNTLTFPNLTVQPLGYDESDTEKAFTAKKWEVTGLLTPSEWFDIVGIYDSWRDARILDADSTVSGVTGTTVLLSVTGADGQTWTDVPCWFLAAPSGEAIGSYIQATVELVDAAQKLQVLLKEKEQEDTAEEDLPDFGTITLGSTVVTLLKPADTYGDGPQLELTASGSHYVTGPLVVYKIKDIEGTTNLQGWNDIRTWYESQIVAYPSSGSYFPISAPTATAERKVVNGVTTDVYTIIIQLGLVL